MATKIQRQVQVSKKKLKAFKKKAVRFIKTPKNKKYIIMAAIALVVLIVFSKYGKKGTTAGNGSGTRNPPVLPPPSGTGSDFPTRAVNAAGAKGIYQLTSPDGERTLYFNRTGEFEPDMRNDGLYDATPGLDTTGPINKLGGKHVFYAMGGAPWYNTESNTYNKMQGVDFTDGIGCITQYICDPNHTPNLQAFITQFPGWNNGINAQNARASRMQFSIWSKTRRGNTIEQPWLKPSRDLIYPTALQPKNWAAYGKFFFSGFINRGDNFAKYQQLGVFPHTDWHNNNPQPETFSTSKVGQGQVMSEAEWYASGQHWANRLGKTLRAYWTSEYGENAQGKDPNTFAKSAHAARGYMDVLRANGQNDVAKAGIYGEYGSFDYEGYFGPNIFDASRADLEKSLTTHLFKGFGVFDGTGVPKFSDQDHAYFTNGLHENCNVNAKYYLYNRYYLLPYEFIYKNERVKLGTTLYQNKGWTRSLSIFSATGVESFVPNPIEITLTGERIPFPNGEMLTRKNTMPAVPWDEMLVLANAGLLITAGAGTWDAPGANLGQDPTKVFIYNTAENPNTQPMYWRKYGSNVWEPYVSGQNGAPVNDPSGLANTLNSTAVEASAAGMEALWPYRNRMQVIRHVAYSSNKGGGFNPTPGTTGHHLNGFGPVNRNQFTIIDLVMNKKGIALDCQGSDGGFIWYYNGFKAAHEYEDITCKGKTFRAYGRKIYQIPY